MKIFLRKISLFFILIACVFLSLFLFDYLVIGNQYSQGYDASLIDKVNRLKAIKEPKIILVGNSNLAFGINSKLIEEAFNMPVVNLGLHGSLGNAFHENISKLNIKKGDIVVVSHLDYSDTGKIENYDLGWITLELNRELWPIVSIDDIPSLLVRYPHYVKKAYKLWKNGEGNKVVDSQYSRKAFNKYGDICYRPSSSQINSEDYFRENGKMFSVPKINDNCTNRLNKLCSYINNKGAHLVIAACPISYGKYTLYSKDDFDFFENNLQNKLKCKVISRYRDYFMSYDKFYDGYPHLTDEAAKIRTNLLINDLKKYKQSIENNKT